MGDPDGRGRTTEESVEYERMVLGKADSRSSLGGQATTRRIVA